MNNLLGTFRDIKDGKAGYFVRIWKEGNSFIDNNTFRLHYRATFNILMICALVVTTCTLADPINCTNPIPENNQIMNLYCWIHTTFTVPAKLAGRVGVNMPHPGVGHTTDPNLIRVTEDGDEIRHAWYQWVPFVLTFQALMFYVPHHLWKYWEGDKIKMMIQDLDEQKLDDPETRKDRRMATVQYFKRTKGSHQCYVGKYIFCEMLNLFNVVAQMFFMDYFLGGQFLDYGVQVLDMLRISVLPFEERVDPMSKVFPKVTKCTFNHYGPSGTVENKDGLCVLPFNMINEKMYILLWFWFVALSVWTGIHFVFRMLSVAFVNFRCFEFKCAILWRDQHELSLLSNRSKGSKKSDLSSVIRKCKYGDFFLLMQLSKHFDPAVYHDFIIDLQDRPKVKRDE